MAKPLFDNTRGFSAPSHDGSIYEGAVKDEDGIIERYEEKLPDELAEATRWFQACIVNRSIADGRRTSAMGATRKHVWKRRYAELNRAVQRARTDMRRIQREREEAAA